LIYRLPVSIPFCCYTYPLRQRICWLSPLVLKLFSALFSLSLQ
jgi:hypothetical protein